MGDSFAHKRRHFCNTMVQDSLRKEVHFDIRKKEKKKMKKTPYIYGSIIKLALLLSDSRTSEAT